MRILSNLVIFIIVLGCGQDKQEFQLCSGKKWPYYHPDLEYSGGFYDIKDNFYNSYKIIESTNNTGIVRIQFDINCKGQSGNFKVETYGLNYRSIEMDSLIINQLIHSTKNLQRWIPAKMDDGSTVNSHKFFAFKIINGRLIDILPK